MRFFYWGLLWLFVSSTAVAQQLVDTVYLNADFVKITDKTQAAYVQYTLFNTPTREDGLIKTFYITGEKYSEHPIQDKTLKTTGYSREWHKNGQLKYEQQIQNNFPIGDLNEWYDNGQLYYIYKDLGNRGEALTYYRNGTRKRIETFEKGKSVQGKCFTQTGQDTIFFPHKEYPVFPGGLENLYMYLGKNVKYSRAAIKQKAQGIVVLQFGVSKAGQIGNVIVLRSVHPELDNEAIRLVNSMPAWQPGKEEGVFKNVRYTLPISFKLR